MSTQIYGITNNPPCEPQRELHVASALNALKSVSSEVKTLALDVSKRYEGVMHSPNPCGQARNSVMMECAVAAQIHDSVELLRDMREILQDMLERCELPAQPVVPPGPVESGKKGLTGIIG